MQMVITCKMQRVIPKSKYDNFFLNFHQVVYLFSSISCLGLKLLAVIVFEILSFLSPNFQRAITKNNFFFIFISKSSYYPLSADNDLSSKLLNFLRYIDYKISL